MSAGGLGTSLEADHAPVYLTPLFDVRSWKMSIITLVELADYLCYCFGPKELG
jgi:hypothetical protein